MRNGPTCRSQKTSLRSVSATLIAKEVSMSKKLLVGIAALAIVALIVVACGGGGGDDQALNASAASEDEAGSEEHATQLTLVTTEWAFTPDTLDVKGGEPVIIVLVNVASSDTRSTFRPCTPADAWSSPGTPHSS